MRLTTPLLIPSFSSKGFGVDKESGKSEIGKIADTAAEFLTDTCLISAYDLKYSHITPPPDLPLRPELIVLDSGGYEISTDRDYSSVIDPLPQPEAWSEELYKSVLDAWPQQLPAVFVSYDDHKHRQSLADQVKAAKALFKGREGHLKLFLMKPETTEQVTLRDVLKAAHANIDQLKYFDIIGVTEKELGNSMLHRMEELAKLRLALDESGIVAPIHVFGALDPISVVLYFISGAEVFDGLTWLRYGYIDDLSAYTHNWGVLRHGIATKDSAVKSRALADNYYYLQRLEQSLRDFAYTQDYSKFGGHAKVVGEAWDSLRRQLKNRV